MATSIMREIWVTQDGTEFNTEAAAVRYDSIDALHTFLRNHDDLYFGREGSSNPWAIATVILDAYTLTPILGGKAS